ncbi:hypothetical protein [Streptomyces sp. MB09-02B]|nr:hypothetical protein [Streptomyces sp. MB09-02B]MDX3645440.1 hypothetical protein [Streptomyces sp. MB09-02B]
MVTGFGVGPSLMEDPVSGVAVKVTVVPTSKVAVQVPVGYGCGSLLA